jgi:aryl-alcohol dehydrogenase-like predicted oxidoreductase
MTYGPVASLQPPYSLFWRQVEQDAKPLCDEKHLSVLAYSSLAQGLLTGKFGPDHQFPEGDVRATNKLFQGELYQQAQTALTQLRPIADRYSTTLGNLALAWLLAQPQICAIVGARSAEQARENAQAAALTLSPEDLASDGCASAAPSPIASMPTPSCGTWTDADHGRAARRYSAITRSREGLASTRPFTSTKAVDSLSSCPFTASNTAPNSF